MSLSPVESELTCLDKAAMPVDSNPTLRFVALIWRMLTASVGFTPSATLANITGFVDTRFPKVTDSCVSSSYCTDVSMPAVKATIFLSPVESEPIFFVVAAAPDESEFTWLLV
ncbi:hypothetical protein PPN31119_04693 [Pandoraea pnomenusa]|uniref:Uncharacterized protein n=1 Tax=Pandoraea pnomenusa TaxID=93220 RepID=A0ABY6WUV0_9BURK|nr:hypothetical protein PPN31119_04693 [Pandoraea pnomenusa]